MFPEESMAIPKGYRSCPSLDPEEPNCVLYVIAASAFHSNKAPTMIQEITYFLNINKKLKIYNTYSIAYYFVFTKIFQLFFIFLFSVFPIVFFLLSYPFLPLIPYALSQNPGHLFG